MIANIFTGTLLRSRVNRELKFGCYKQGALTELLYRVLNLMSANMFSNEAPKEPPVSSYENVGIMFGSGRSLLNLQRQIVLNQKKRT